MALLRGVGSADTCFFNRHLGLRLFLRRLDFVCLLPLGYGDAK
jgi:hypothetical protein